ncbi:hypothetical protein [Rubinisphaera italica]|uniref:Uncharacterized protein n=1 Tax=Rubinisphaera italica TaxID=2527969 RepID=A0A5C5XJZ0_9PLAN|nr:hypothetical protein [Rubinisphaera italica]TWT63164.1 hypothetical protein Pan54_39170 [Rubinisphaera italica]
MAYVERFKAILLITPSNEKNRLYHEYVRETEGISRPSVALWPNGSLAPDRIQQQLQMNGFDSQVIKIELSEVEG